MPFDFTSLEIPDVIQIQPKVFGDERGFFIETYKASEFQTFGITENFVQDNHSRSLKNVIRGLHYQKLDKSQAKLIRCIQGKIIDIAVDIRVGSPTYSKWVNVCLSEENKSILYVPVGFAHGFLVLSETAEVLYKTDKEYSPENDAGIRWDDPEIAIDWHRWSTETPVISEKDRNLPFLKDAVKF